MTQGLIQGPLIQTFNTHRLPDDVVRALMTGRTRERDEILSVMEANLEKSPGGLQHVIIYGARGFGKSFLVRMVQVEAQKRADQGAPLAFVLLPEEQHNLIRSPWGLLDYLGLKLADLRQGTDRSWEGAMFRWPDPKKAEVEWQKAERELEEELDQSLAGSKSLAVVVVENFDILLNTVFKTKADQQLLRRWMNKRDLRCMILATATGAVDVDYEQPLFQAFRPVRLQPWTQEDCLDYFNRRRIFSGRVVLSPEEEAKARAVSDFIGGAPRLARLLADVLDVGSGFEEGNPLSVAEIMDALADKLADYYRRRIDDLPPLAQGLLDALIRGGEPCSATELAKRVHADGQNVIARVIKDLQRADMIRGLPDPDGREKLFRVVDRVFVHFYRIRQGHLQAIDSPLATILDFLRAFYNPTEHWQQARRFKDAGHPKEADLFARLAREGVSGSSHSDYRNQFLYRLGRLLEVASESWPGTAEEIIQKLTDTPAQVVDDVKRLPRAATPLDAAIRSVILAQAYTRLGLADQAAALLETACKEAEDDPEAIIVVADEYVTFLLGEQGGLFQAVEWAHIAGKQREQKLPPMLRGAALKNHAWSLIHQKNYEDADEAVSKASTGAAETGDNWEPTMVREVREGSFDSLKRYEETIDAATNAIQLSGGTGNKYEKAELLCIKAEALQALKRHDEAIAVALEAAILAEKLDVRRIKLKANVLAGLSFAVTKRHTQAYDSFVSVFNHALQANAPRAAEEGALLSLLTAKISSQPGIIDLFDRWRKETIGWIKPGPHKQSIKGIMGAGQHVSLFLTAATRARSWTALDGFLDQHLGWLAENLGSFQRFDEIGQAIARVGADEGRAAGYDAAQGILSRLALIISSLPEGAQEDDWLAPVISALAEDCHDAGLLRDVAGFLTEDFHPEAPFQAGLLNHLADFEAAGDRRAGVLARMSPDVVLWIRRIRNLPEEKPAPSKKRKGRK